jgi:thymidylate synthase (FAD)
MPVHDSPSVYLVSRPMVDYDQLSTYLEEAGGLAWGDKIGDIDAQNLVEAAGRLCYRSWEPGLNPNVTKIRTGQDKYLENILIQQHGSVLEHANFTFIFRSVSRVFTHELVRHRAGTAISQESMRFVRLDHIPFWFPQWAEKDEALMARLTAALSDMEDLQLWLAEHFELDKPGVPFHEKKAKTSFMRRFAPEGVLTDIMWTANIRTLRHVIESRTAPGAEEEIRMVFGLVGQHMLQEAPALFADYAVSDDGHWVPAWRKV